MEFCGFLPLYVLIVLTYAVLHLNLSPALTGEADIKWGFEVGSQGKIFSVIPRFF